ncbi:MAG: hypothetical protein WBW93_09460 [Steroidobacteraceae bacterium]
MSAAALKAPVDIRQRVFQGTRIASDFGIETAKRIARANSRVGVAAQNWEPQIAAAAAAIQADCSMPDWDGEQAAPVSTEALALAQRVAALFYCFVPRDTPAPELLPDADGDVSLSWTRDRERMFAVSIGNHNKLNYAGRLGGGVEPHDVAIFNPEDPSAIQQIATYVVRLFK